MGCGSRQAARRSSGTRSSCCRRGREEQPVAQPAAMLHWPGIVNKGELGPTPSHRCRRPTSGTLSILLQHAPPLLRSLNAMAVFEAGYKDDMSKEEAMELVARAIRWAPAPLCTACLPRSGRQGTS